MVIHVRLRNLDNLLDSYILYWLLNFVAESAFVRPSNKVPFLNKILNREKREKEEKKGKSIS